MSHRKKNMKISKFMENKSIPVLTIKKKFLFSTFKTEKKNCKGKMKRNGYIKTNQNQYI